MAQLVTNLPEMWDLILIIIFISPMFYKVHLQRANLKNSSAAHLGQWFLALAQH